MSRSTQHPLSSRMTWLGVGALVGMCIGGLAPHSPVHATATAQIENFAIATGPVQDGLEGVYFLDHLTGELKGAVMSPRMGKFIAKYQTNVLKDLELDPAGKPKLLMVTGVCDYQRAAGGVQLGSGTIYVVDATSSRVGAFAVPWNKQITTGTKPVLGAFVKVDGLVLRDVEVRSP